MPGKHLFEYAVIRVVPRVEREEFMNVGVVLYCADHKFLNMVYELDEEKLFSFYNQLDLDELKARLHAFHHICCGAAEGGTIGKLPLASRFRWLTASRSTVIQTSAVHPGLCDDPATTLQKLQEQLVM